MAICFYTIFKNVVEAIWNKFLGDVPNLAMTVIVFGLGIVAVIPIVLLSNVIIAEVYRKSERRYC